MKVAVDSLGLFNRLAAKGAEHAAESLSSLTGVEMAVDVTDITLLTQADLQEAFGGREYAGVKIGFEGGLNGETVLAFRRGDVGALLSSLLPGHDPSPDEELDAMARSGVEEVGNITIGGFIDGWANHLGTGIDITPPEYVAAEGTGVLPDHAFRGDGGVILFQSELKSRRVGSEFEFGLYMLPQYEALTKLLAERSGDDEAGLLPLGALSRFNRMTSEGAANAAEHLTTMTGVETDVEVSQLRFLPIEDVPIHVGDRRRAGTAFELSGATDGYLLVLFDERSAEVVADEMTPMETGDGIGELERSALEEIGNVMTSGFIDGWANVLGTSIEHSPPEFVHDMGSAIVDPMIGRLAECRDHAFVIDSTIETETREVACDIYTLPEERDLTAALSAIAESEGEQHVPGGS